MKTKSAFGALMVLLTLLLSSCVTQEQLIIEKALPATVEPAIQTPVEELEESSIPVSPLVEDIEPEKPLVVEEEPEKSIATEEEPIELIEEGEQELSVVEKVRFTNATAIQFHHILLPLADQLDFDDILSGTILEEQDSFELDLEFWPYLQKVITEGINEPLEIYVWAEDGTMLFRLWSPLTESWIIVLSPEDYLE